MSKDIEEIYGIYPGLPKKMEQLNSLINNIGTNIIYLYH